MASPEAALLLPNTDPRIATALLGLIQANPTMTLSQIVLSLISRAADVDIALQCVQAALELTATAAHGEIVKAGTPATTLFVGARLMGDHDALAVGPAGWPLSVLMDGPPVTLSTVCPDGTIALAHVAGNLGYLVTDEGAALSLGVRTIQALGGAVHTAATLRAYLAEAYPGTLRPGMLVVPAEPEGLAPYIVECRMPGSGWVCIAAMAADAQPVPAGAWLPFQGDLELPAGADPYAGFTSDPTGPLDVGAA